MIKYNKITEPPSYRVTTELKDFIKTIKLNDDDKKILKIIIKSNSNIIVFKYKLLEDYPYLYKGEIEYVFNNIESCKFTFLFKFKNNEQP